MMAAAQPFISGAISKTINLPNEATVDEIGACYRLSWELGLKANALYRDGCKLSQPLSTKSDKTDAEDLREEEDTEGLEEAVSAEVQVERIVEERIVERVVERPMRRRLPDTRESITHKFNVAGHEGYLIVGLYEDGKPGELFITMAKEGSTIGGLMDSLGTAVSLAFQYGVPVESIVNKFAHQRFEPMGMTANADIPFAKSLVDYIFRWLGMQFIEGFREENAPRRARPAELPAGNAGTGGAGSAAHTPSKEAAWHDRPSANAHDGTSASPTSPHHGSGDGRASADVHSILSTRTVTGVRAESIIDASGGAVSRTTVVETVTVAEAGASASVMTQSNAQLMGDAPPCSTCGEITVRNGTCYRCLNCGTSMGCS